jgi:hypothetical protein
VCSHFGWTLDYLLHGIPWGTVQRMLIDAPGVERIPEGTEVAIADEPLEPSALLDQESMTEAKITGKVRISGECLKFDKGRLHSRLWV